jgi:vacuolar-type H+-ATPase subunit H
MADRDTPFGTPSGPEPGSTGGAADKAREIKDQAQEKVANVAAEARDRGEHLVEEGKDKARELGEQAVEVARSRGDEQRERVAEGVRTFAYALRRGADDLPQDRREYERYIDDVADRVESVSRYIQERDVDALTREARRFARDHTPVFLAGAFTLGLLGARFIKSSGDEAREQRFGGMGRDRDRAGWAGRYDETSPYASEGRQGRSSSGYGRPSTGAEGGGYA